MKDFIKQVLSSASGSLSSKRLCGIAGFFVILVIYIYSAITGKQMPECTESIFYGICLLLGVDSITSIFKKNQ